MKITILASIATVLFVFQSNAETYNKFIEPNKSWGIYNGCIGGSNTCVLYNAQPYTGPNQMSKTNFIKFYFNGDTLVNSVKYNKLYALNLYSDGSLAKCNNCSPYLASLIREDTIAKRVFGLAYPRRYKGTGDTTRFFAGIVDSIHTLVEYEMFNFNLNVGDSVILNRTFEKTKYKVASKSIKNFPDGISRTIWTFGNQDTLIEGVGLTHHAFPFTDMKNPYNNSIIDYSLYNMFLAAVIRNGIGIYGNNHDVVLLDLEKPTALAAYEVSVFPIPAKNQLTITCPQSLNQFVDILDLQGNIKLSSPISGSLHLDISDFHSGVYIYHLKGGNDKRGLFIVE